MPVVEWYNAESTIDDFETDAAAYAEILRNITFMQRQSLREQIRNTPTPWTKPERKKSGFAKFVKKIEGST